MTELVFIRHAETDMSGTFCGHSDPPLNLRGHAQVCQLIERLATESFAELYSSDLQRATETATPLAKALGVPCTSSPLLREIDFGEWEGLTWIEIEQRDAAFARQWMTSFPVLSAPGGELFGEFERRVLREIDRLSRLAVGTRIAVVTHAGVMRVVLCNLLGWDEQQAWNLTKSYCSTFVYTASGALEGASR